MDNKKQLLEFTDFFVAYKFIKILTQDYKDTDAFKLGIVDDKGNILKQRKDLTTGKEKAAYTIFHTLIWNIKKLLQKVPGVKSKLGSYATALFLLKESCNNDDEVKSIVNYLFENSVEHDSDAIFEDVIVDDKLSEGVYITTQEIVTPDYEFLNEGEIIIIRNDTKPFTDFKGINLYEVLHMNSGKSIIISKSTVEKLCEDIEGAPETFAGAAVFDIESDNVSSDYNIKHISPSRQKYEKWNNTLDMDNDANKKIRKYIHRNPTKDVILRNKNGEMSYFYKSKTKGNK
jgi:hypothetical protein